MVGSPAREPSPDVIRSSRQLEIGVSVTIAVQRTVIVAVTRYFTGICIVWFVCALFVFSICAFFILYSGTKRINMTS